jgi:hypothetical protein
LHEKLRVKFCKPPPPLWGKRQVCADIRANSGHVVPQGGDINRTGCQLPPSSAEEIAIFVCLSARVQLPYPGLNVFIPLCSYQTCNILVQSYLSLWRRTVAELFRRGTVVKLFLHMYVGQWSSCSYVGPWSSCSCVGTWSSFATCGGGQAVPTWDRGQAVPTWDRGQAVLTWDRGQAVPTRDCGQAIFTEVNYCVVIIQRPRYKVLSLEFLISTIILYSSVNVHQQWGEYT